MAPNSGNGIDATYEVTQQNPTEAVARAQDDGKHHLLLAASGSVATIKIVPIIKALSSRKNISIRLILTPSASKFLDGQSAEQPSLADIARFPNVHGIYNDASEWSPAWTRGAPILHIELRKWAHLMVIAPLSANTLAKVTTGLCDSLLTSVWRAWDTAGNIDNANAPGRRKQIICCPAMNVCMWRHPITQKQIKTLEQDWGVENDGWVEVLRPIEKTLACGDVGEGAMVSFEQIVAAIDDRLGLECTTSD